MKDGNVCKRLELCMCGSCVMRWVISHLVGQGQPPDLPHCRHSMQQGFLQREGEVSIATSPHPVQIHQPFSFSSSTFENSGFFPPGCINLCTTFCAGEDIKCVS